MSVYLRTVLFSRATIPDISKVQSHFWAFLGFWAMVSTNRFGGHALKGTLRFDSLFCFCLSFWRPVPSCFSVRLLVCSMLISWFGMCAYGCVCSPNPCNCCLSVFLVRAFGFLSNMAVCPLEKGMFVLEELWKRFSMSCSLACGCLCFCCC